MMNLKHEFLNINKYFFPKIIGAVNDQYIKLAKIKGQAIPWHNHENEDELFFIVEGSLLMEIENQEAFIMQKEDLYVVKKGVNHRVSSKEECLLMLIESKNTEHTGEITSAITKTIGDQFY
jgi:mannose-6-phosphate isomerase-like protein (cupin superfamily)